MIKLICAAAIAAIALYLPTVAFADGKNHRGTLNPAATPLILHVDAAVLATGERIPDYSNMGVPLPN